MKRFMLLTIPVMLLIACGKGESAPEPSSPSTASQKTSPTSNTGGYAPPADVCALVEPTLLGPEAGKPGKGTPETEKTTYTLNGCIFDMQADSNNTLKLWMAVDADAPARYEEFEKMFSELGIPGFTTESVSGLGTKAVYRVRRSAQNLRIEGFLGFYDNNLYIEIRFMGGGTKEWNPDALREGLVKVARHAMSKVQKK